MATTSKVLFRGAASGSSATYELLLNDVVLAKTVTVGSLDSTIIQLKQPLTAAQTIKGLASATTVNFHISGVEIA